MGISSPALNVRVICQTGAAPSAARTSLRCCLHLWPRMGLGSSKCQIVKTCSGICRVCTFPHTLWSKGSVRCSLQMCMMSSGSVHVFSGNVLVTVTVCNVSEHFWVQWLGKRLSMAASDFLYKNVRNLFRKCILFACYVFHIMYIYVYMCVFHETLYSFKALM